MPPYWGWVTCEAGKAARFQMLLGGNDDGVALRFFWNGHYERKTLSLWAELAKTAKLALDIGAHTGVYTLCARASNAHCRVASFEPHFMNFSRLNINLRSNGFATSDAFMIAVGSESGTVPFTVRTGLDYLTTGGTVGNAGSGTVSQVQVARLDTFIPPAMAALVSLVKVDVEGYEANCLKGMESLIRQSHPDIFFECIDAGAGQTVQGFLEPMEYTFFEIDDLAGTVTPIEQVRPVYEAPGKIAMHRLNRIATHRSSNTANKLRAGAILATAN